jgi:hypothetical protein
MLAWWAVVWPWTIIPLADNAWRKWWPARSPDQQRPPQAMTTVTAMGFVFMCLLLAPPSQSLISGRPRGIAATTSSDTPLFVAERLAQQKMQGRIYAPLDWADYLIWRGGQQIQPLVYSHVHLVHPDIFHQYQRISIGDRSWLQLARAQKLKYLVISRDRNRALLREVLLARQQESSQVRVVYQDQQAVIAELL